MIFTRMRGRIWWEGGGADAPFPRQRFDPLSTQRVPLCTILGYPFLEQKFLPKQGLFSALGELGKTIFPIPLKKVLDPPLQE